MAIKDLFHSLFQEDVEEDEYEEENGEVEDVQLSARVEEIPEEPVYISRIVETEPEPQPAQKKGPSIFTGLDITNVSSKPAPAKSAQKAQPKRRQAVQPKVVVEEYQAVISPIFGNVEDDKKEFDKVHDAITLPKPEEGFDMTTVISPMFGNDLPTPQPRKIPSYRRQDKPVQPAADLVDNGKEGE